MAAAARLRVIKRHLQQAKCDFVPTAAGLASVNQTFKYTLDSPVLTFEQRQFYEENGFIIIPGLVPPNRLDEWKDHFLAYCEGRIPKGQVTLMKDITLAKTGATGERLYNKLQDFAYDDVLFEYCALPEIVKYVKCFTGPNVMAAHTMLINKPPDIGTLSSRHPLHQDLYYFPFRPSERIVCAWTAMEKVTRENGCLVAIPGTHKGQLERHEYPEWQNGVNALYLGIKGYENVPRVYAEMEKGDTIFFHPLLIHGSGANRTQGFRKAISCHYAASECHYIDVRGTMQEMVAQEVDKVARKRGYYEVDYRDIWRARMRLVAGEMVTL